MNRAIAFLRFFVIAVCCAFPIGLANAAPPSKDLYIIVPKEAPGPELDFAAHGAKKKGEWFGRGQRIVVEIPEPAVEAFRRHPRVKYIQKIVPAGQQESRLPSSAVGSMEHVDMMSVGTHSAPAWTTGAYEYDGAGNITTIGANQYVYDASSRLRQASTAAPGVTHYDTYKYDGYGNLRMRKTNQTGFTAESPNPLVIQVDPTTNRLPTTMGVTYDVAGNVTQNGYAQFSYDSFNMVTNRFRVQEGYYQYIYTASDERIAVGNGRAPSSDLGFWFAWTIRDLGGRVVREYESAYEFSQFSAFTEFLWVEDYVYRGSTVLGAEREPEEGGRRHFHTDHLGSPRVVTSQSGDRLAEHVYFPFGVAATSIRQDVTRGFDREEPVRFTGHERDFNAGTMVENQGYLDYMHARYYNPVWGRFLSVDPGGFDSKRPQSWNRYTYVRNNPITLVDPDGRDPVALAGAVIGYVAGAIVEVHNQGWGNSQPVNYSRVRNAATGAALTGTLTGLCKCPLAIGAGGSAILGGSLTRFLNKEKATVSGVATDFAGGVIGGKLGQIGGAKLVGESVKDQTLRAAALNADSLASNTGLGADKAARLLIEVTKATGAAGGNALVEPVVGIVKEEIKVLAADEIKDQ